MSPTQNSLVLALVQGRGHRSIVAFCEKKKIERISLYRCVAGHARPATYAKIAKALGVSVADLRSIAALGIRS